MWLYCALCISFLMILFIIFYIVFLLVDLCQLPWASDTNISNKYFNILFLFNGLQLYIVLEAHLRECKLIKLTSACHTLHSYESSRSAISKAETIACR